MTPTLGSSPVTRMAHHRNKARLHQNHSWGVRRASGCACSRVSGIPSELAPDTHTKLPASLLPHSLTTCTGHGPWLSLLTCFRILFSQLCSVLAILESNFRKDAEELSDLTRRNLHFSVGGFRLQFAYRWLQLSLLHQVSWPRSTAPHTLGEKFSCTKSASLQCGRDTGLRRWLFCCTKTPCTKARAEPACNSKAAVWHTDWMPCWKQHCLVMHQKSRAPHCLH